MQPTKTEAIANFLNHKALPDLAKLYSPAMEVQCNVAQDNGERIDKEYKGKKYTAWTDNSGEVWKSFRIPLHANTSPVYNDSRIGFDLAKHAEGIGLTGWDFMFKKSRWVAFDFDAIVGHSDKHESKLTDSELNAVRQAAFQIPWATIRKSTSGNGLHIYVFVKEVDTQNHNEHSALARAILAKMSATTSFDFDSRVDNCGGIMWVWHHKFDKSEGEGLKLLKQGEVLSDIPVNWKEHIRVTSGKRRRTVPGFVKEKEIDWFEQMCGQHPKISLDAKHKDLLEFLDSINALWWFDPDHWMLVCHTADLKEAHGKLGMRGLFDTAASGKDRGGDQNAFAFPLRDGAWVVRRHTPGVREQSLWDQDAAGWTRCFLNKDPDLKIAAKAFGGAEDENGSFMFNEAEVAIQVAGQLGAHVDLNNAYSNRLATLKPHKDGRLILEIERAEGDNEKLFPGWVNKKRVWRKVITSSVPAKYEKEVSNFDDVVRHLVSETGGDAGWTVNSEGIWKEEPLAHVKLVLRALGNNSVETDLIVGKAVLQRWTLVNRPFMPEYLDDRQWNRDSAQFSVTPSEDIDGLKYGTWESLLNHCGEGLDFAIQNHSWCKEAGIKTGGEYLSLWVASMFQNPYEPLPYLFMYGPQGTGKSTFHEAIRLLVTKGVVRADAALISQSGFNGELNSAVLCVVEETDLRQNRTQAYNRIKDWVTGKTINIHVKGNTPYSAINTTHWVQCANEIELCPIFPGDTRITMCRVDPLDADKHIAKRDYLEMLRKEAPDFLSHILRLEVPRVNDRLAIPVIETEDKVKASKLNQNELQAFLEEHCYFVSGRMILLGEFYDRFMEWLDPERKTFWTKQKISRHMPSEIVKGRWMQDKARHYYGNVSWTPKNPEDAPEPKLSVNGEKLEYENLG